MSTVRRGVRVKAAVIAFVAATLAAGAFQGYVASRMGGWSGLLAASAAHHSLEVIERELGPVHEWNEGGHDGRFQYVIARDPLALGDGLRYVDDPTYRHRRILQPLLAGLGGTLPPGGALGGLILLSAIGTGLAAGGATYIGRQLGGRAWSGVGVVANLGVLASLSMTTPDGLALGLSLCGVAAGIARRMWWSAALLTLGALTKETYLVVAAGFCAYLVTQGDWRSAVRVGLAPVASTAAWTGVLVSRFGPGATNAAALGAPFAGALRAAQMWINGDVGSGSPMFVVTLLACALVLWRARQPLLWFLAVPWIGLATVSSHVVWLRDAPRAFAPVGVILVIGLAVVVATRPEARSADRRRDDLATVGLHQN